MQLEAESLAQKFKQAMVIWLLQLPSKVRSLTLDEFINKYDGDINKVIRGVQQLSVDSVMTPIPDRAELKSTLKANTMQSIKRLQQYLRMNGTDTHFDGISPQTPMGGRAVATTTTESRSDQNVEEITRSRSDDTAQNIHTVNPTPLNTTSQSEASRLVIVTATNSDTLKTTVPDRAEDKETSKELELKASTKSETPLESVSRETAEQMLLLATRTPSKSNAFASQRKQNTSTIATNATASKDDKRHAVDSLKQQMGLLQKVLQK
jgi:hypothetical protein